MWTYKTGGLILQDVFIAEYQIWWSFMAGIVQSTDYCTVIINIILINAIALTRSTVAVSSRHSAARLPTNI